MDKDELSRLRKNARPDMDIVLCRLLDHIDAQDHQIAVLEKMINHQLHVRYASGPGASEQ
jgi:hypothetical protein